MPELKKYFCGVMKDGPFSVVNDGSNDNILRKMNATCAVIVYVNRSS